MPEKYRVTARESISKFLASDIHTQPIVYHRASFYWLWNYPGPVGPPFYERTKVEQGGGTVCACVCVREFPRVRVNKIFQRVKESSDLSCR